MVSFELKIKKENLEEIFKKIDLIKSKYRDAIIVVHADWE